MSMRSDKMFDAEEESHGGAFDADLRAGRSPDDRDAPIFSTRRYAPSLRCAAAPGLFLLSASITRSAMSPSGSTAEAGACARSKRSPRRSAGGAALTACGPSRRFLEAARTGGRAAFS